MEITTSVFDQASCNLAWLYIESTFEVEIRLQLKVTNRAQFIPNFEDYCGEIDGQLITHQFTIPTRVKHILRELLNCRAESITV